MQRFLTYALATVLFIIFLATLSVKASVPHEFQIAWFPAFGINLDFYTDGLSRLFILLISFIGVLIVFYSQTYLCTSKIYRRYILFIAIFTLGMLLAVTADNLIVLFVAWEITTISSYLLISYHYRKEKSRTAALQGLMVTMFGGIFLLLMAFLLYGITGSWDISTIIQLHEQILQSPYYPLIFVFFLLAVMTKSAQWPFHFWLPNAMEAPTPVSAYLHSATMVKLGLYLTARFLPLLGGTAWWHYGLGMVAMVTLVVAGVLCIMQFDLKKLLAYSTIMSLSLVLLLLADGTALSVQAAMAFLCAHALYKAALFLCAGSIDQSTGTRDIRELGGLWRVLPVTFVVLLLAGISLAGIPPVLGFVTKELVYEAKLSFSAVAYIDLPVCILANAVFVWLALVLIVKLFFGRSSLSYRPTESLRLLWSPAILSVMSLLFGIWPNVMNTALVVPAVSAVVHEPNVKLLSIWHGVTPSLLLSVLTVCLGLIAYLCYRKLSEKLQRLLPCFGMENVYRAGMAWLNRVGFLTTRLFQSGRLTEYVAVVFLFFSVIMWAVFIASCDINQLKWIPHAPWFDWLVVLVLIASACMTVFSAPYMVSLVMLGVVGLATTFIFILYSAPDVAITQLLVDILTVVIIVLALYRLPKLPKLQAVSRFYRIRNAIIASSIGLLITMMMIASFNVPFNRFLSEFYTANSFLLAHGKNVVNVILVDFRAFDTLGESLVVAMAGLGVYILWRRLRLRGEEQ